MKTRRSLHSEKVFLQSILFPNKQNENSLSAIVPESPETTCTASISNTATASVLETPDENILKRNGTSKVKIKSFETATPKPFADDLLLVDETPDLNLKNRKGIISILESEYSEPIPSNSAHDEPNICARNRRKSIAETILPFDLNDDENLARKLAQIGKNNCKRKSINQNRSKKINGNLSPVINRSKNSKNNLVLHSIYNNVRRNSSFLSNTSLNDSLISCDSDLQTGINKNQNATSISFENSDLDLTDANCENEILVSCQPNSENHFPTKNLSIQNGFVNSPKQVYNSSEIPNLSLKNIDSAHIHEDNEFAHNIKNTPCRNYKKILEGDLSPINRSLFECDEAFSPTQPACILILQGVTAIVDVRDGGENRSAAFKDLIISLGAKVVDKFTPEVTHVLFREGSRTTYHKALEKGVHLVPPLWVEACRVKNVRVSESLFPIAGVITKNGKVTVPRKKKSMQPRNFEEAMKLAEIKFKKKMERLEKEKLQMESQAAPVTPKGVPKLSAKDVNSPLYRLANLQKPLLNSSLSSSNESGDDGSSSEEDCKTPLAMRLYKRLVAQNANSANSTPKIVVDSVSSHEDREENSGSLLFTKDNGSINNSSTSHLHDNRDNSRFLNEKGKEEASPAKILNNAQENVKHSVTKEPVEDLNKSKEISNKKIERRRSTRLAVTNKCINDVNKSNISLPMKKDILANVQIKSKSLPSGSNTSLSVVKRRKLHTVDCTPNENLIVPATPPTSLRKRDAGIYDSIKKQNLSQRAEMKRFKGKFNEELSVFPLPRSSKHRVSRENTENDDDDNNNDKIEIKSSKKLTPVSECNETPKRSAKGRFSIVPRKRMSVEDFMPRCNLRKRMSRKRTSPKMSRPSICITGCHADNIESLYAIIKSLGGFHTTSDVNANTTHVICGSERRTLNVLLGISQGCWILDVSWFYESVELLKWAPEEPFELFNFCPGAKISRMSRLNISESFKPTLLQKFGRIFVQDSVDPPSYTIQDMLLNCGANICSTLRSADFIIDTKKTDISLKQVSPKWLFDSIQHWTAKNLDDYLL